MGNLKNNILKNKILETIKYDYNHLKLPLVIFAFLLIYMNILLGRKIPAFNLVSSIYRTGWKGSFWLGQYFTKRFLGTKKKADLMLRLAIDDINPLPNTEKFFTQPEKMLGTIITVLKSPKENEKGVLILNYSYYFLMFHKLYQVENILDNYIIILEPSWAGFCELSILSYMHLPQDVYLMCYEKRDLKFISSLHSSLIPLEIGPSWFVNHENFQPLVVEQNIDVIMVAAWAKFKRHGDFFKAIAKLKEQGITPKIVLVGYQVDMTKQQILDLALHHGVEKWITIYESITHAEVAELLNESKVNVLWSKFEGNNRAIIEGMFCNTTVIMREGHNYGEKYDFINNHTGCFADEDTLAASITKILSTYDNYTPRDYVLNNRSCIKATEIMNKVLSKREQAQGRNWTEDMTVKVNELHQMDYLDPSVRDSFSGDYKYLFEQLNVKTD
ncbi:MAG: glycosyltransferase involved in cell wall biosynthesis [Psychromonas sp.]|jgi:glycosyltransferase involved in cell wall biosynthesis